MPHDANDEKPEPDPREDDVDDDEVPGHDSSCDHVETDDLLAYWRRAYESARR